MKCALGRLELMPKNMCRNRREKYRFWRNSRRMTANTSASPKAVVVASMLYLVLLVGG